MILSTLSSFSGDALALSEAGNMTEAAEVIRDVCRRGRRESHTRSLRRRLKNPVEGLIRQHGGEGTKGGASSKIFYFSTLERSPHHPPRAVFAHASAKNER